MPRADDWLSFLLYLSQKWGIAICVGVQTQSRNCLNLAKDPRINKISQYHETFYDQACAYWPNVESRNFIPSFLYGFLKDFSSCILSCMLHSSSVNYFVQRTDTDFSDYN